MTLVIPGSLHIPVAVIVERRRGITPWQDWVWRAVGVQEDAPELPAWTLLRDDGDRALFHAGMAELALYPTDTSNYLHNLQSAEPRLWVVLRDGDSPTGLVLHAATVDAGEAHLYADTGSDIVDALPMPPALRDAVETFVAKHHVERAFHKRKRDRQDTDSLGARPGGRRAAEDEDE
jgi:hypothetical protein